MDMLYVPELCNLLERIELVKYADLWYKGFCCVKKQADNNDLFGNENYCERIRITERMI